MCHFWPCQRLKFARSFGVKILTIHELLDIDIKKFERENNVKIKGGFTNMLQDSGSKTSRSKSVLSRSKTPKKKFSDFHLQVGLGKRLDPEFEEKREAKIRWEKINIKKDHLQKFIEKSAQHRVF